jgi:hypothetical protein
MCMGQVLTSQIMGWKTRRQLLYNVKNISIHDVVWTWLMMLSVHPCQLKLDWVQKKWCGRRAMRWRPTEECRTTWKEETMNLGRGLRIESNVGMVIVGNNAQSWSGSCNGVFLRQDTLRSDNEIRTRSIQILVTIPHATRLPLHYQPEGAKPTRKKPVPI